MDRGYVRMRLLGWTEFSLSPENFEFPFGA